MHQEGSGFRVSGILILPGEPLAKGYYKWHSEKKGKKVHVHKTNAKTNTQKWSCKNNTVKLIVIVNFMQIKTRLN